MEAQHFVIVFESRKYNYIYHSYESYDRHSNRGCTVDGGRKACNTCRNASHGLSYRGSRAKASFTACFRTQTVSLQVVTLFGKSHAPRRAILASESRAAGTAFTTAARGRARMPCPRQRSRRVSGSSLRAKSEAEGPWDAPSSRAARQVFETVQNSLSH